MREMKDSNVKWIAEIPSSWEISPVKYLFDIYSGATPQSAVEEYWDGDVLWITPADYKTKDKYVYGGKRNISEMGLKSCSATIIPKGSVIFSKRAPIGTVAINAVPLSTNQGCLSCVPNKLCEAEFYYYFMSIYIEIFDLLGSGTTFKEISASSFANVATPFPKRDEQAAIVNFLSRKCIEIDTLSNDIQVQIDTLEQYKKTIIVKAVTKGLNPMAEMKNSTIDNIDSIPVMWEDKKIKFLFSLSNDKNYRPLEEVKLLSLYTEFGVFPHGEQDERGNKAVNADGYMIVRKDDIVVNIILAWMGAIGMSNYDGVTSPAYDVYRPLKNVIIPKFYHYLFRTTWFAGECYKYGRGIMAVRWRTYSSEFKNIRVPYPPIGEQQEIVDYLDDKCTEIDMAISEKKKQLETLSEYKKSVIYEYVTGKKEVVV